jgi:glycosyltransferase involved in cell wall biosynthesis
MRTICIIIPCYNETGRFPREAFDRFYELSPSIRFVLVNDGSTDATSALLHGIAQGRDERIKVLDLAENCGKAEAVRQGAWTAFGMSDVDSIGFFDADFATPLEEVFHLENALYAAPDILIALGSRIARMGASIIRNQKRHYFGRVLSTMASTMLGLPVYDTQCGAKLMRREAIPVVCVEPFITRWLFDVEILARMLIAYGRESAAKKIVEFPLNVWHEQPGSKISFFYFLKMPFELLAIKKKYCKSIS